MIIEEPDVAVLKLAASPCAQKHRESREVEGRAPVIIVCIIGIGS
jgi:hypothetical protein